MQLQHGTYVLLLNPMRAANVEHQVPVACAHTRTELEELLLREQCEPYRDGTWGKSFRVGGPLEWYNPPMPEFGPAIVQYETPQVPSLSELAARFP